MSFDAHLYALLHRGNPGDVQLYRAMCAGARTVLELGCGAGRVAAPLAADGIEVTGVDLHPGMCALARAAAPTAHIVEGDMATVDLGRRFERVIIPYNGLYCAADDAGALAVLRNAARHLTDDGMLIFDGYQVDTDPDDLIDDEIPEWLTTLVDGERRIEVFEQDRHRPERSEVAVTYLYEIEGGGGPPRTVRYTLRHHYLDPHAVADLLADAGLMVLGMWGDFDRGPVEGGDRMVVAAGLAPEE